MSGIFDFLKDDWKKIPANYRLLIIAGGFFMFNSWLLDHWGSKEPYWFWSWDIRAIGYSVGLTLIILSILMIIIKQFVYFKNLIYYRLKYPLNKLGIDFFLTSFKGYVVLFDINERKYYHIWPWETAQDLLFVDRWNYLDKDFPPDQRELLQVGRRNLYKEFRYFRDGGIIYTRS